MSVSHPCGWYRRSTVKPLFEGVDVDPVAPVVLGKEGEVVVDTQVEGGLILVAPGVEPHDCLRLPYRRSAIGNDVSGIGDPCRQGRWITRGPHHFSCRWLRRFSGMVFSCSSWAVNSPGRESLMWKNMWHKYVWVVESNETVAMER